MEYGFLSERDEPVASSRQRLLHLVRRRSLPSLVWTPETAEMVPPWEVPYLLEVMREPVVAAARRQVRIAQGVLAGFAGLSVLLLAMSPLLWLVVVVAAGGLLVLLVRSMRRRVRAAEALDAEQFGRSMDALVEQRVDEARPAPVTNRMTVSLIAVGICQLLFMDTSVAAGAVSREAMAAGEWWRLFTAPMLHGGVLHFWMNFGALESLGRTIETRAVRAYVPLVFVAAALAGGAFSVLLPPHGQSVGASGGLMGMFGFLAVMAWRRKKHLPEGLLRGLLINMGLIALVGVIAYRFIDNAAHAGGLLAGLLMGLAAVPHGDREWTESPRLGRAGYVAQGVIFTSAALAIGLTLFFAFG